MTDRKLIKKRQIRKIKCMLSCLIPDELYIKYMFRKNLGTYPNLKNPKTFNEKMNWMKLHYRKNEFTDMADKYKVKSIVADKIGEEYVIPLLGVWDRFEDIDFSYLPDSFVLKPNNGCGDLLICKNREEKEKLDPDFWKKLFDINLSTKYYALSREWPYRNIKPKIIAEKYMSDTDESGELSDYKFFCFDGKPEMMFVATGRSTDCRFDFYDMDFQHIDLYNLHPNADAEIKKPSGFEKMKELASVLSQGLPFVRVDFYEMNGKVYFGEYTFYHSGAFSSFAPEKWDAELGSMIKLS